MHLFMPFIASSNTPIESQESKKNLDKHWKSHYLRV